jgi:tRNA/rRNA methyltransferase
MRTRFILIDTSHAGNVGATARAMKVMGFEELVLVNPRFPNVLNRDETIQRASGALDVLKNARVVSHLDEALEGLTHLCATAMVPRDFGPPTRAPREHLATLSQGLEGVGQAAPTGQRGVGFLFGSERFGMKNEDVYRCHVALTIPSNPSFGSLNLAAAVQLLAYEWRLALGGFRPQSVASQQPLEPSFISPPNSGDQAFLAPLGHPLADAQAIAGLLKHWEASLISIGFLDPLAPKKLMPRLQQLFNRAQLTEEEVHILRGVAKHMGEGSRRKEIDS